MWLQQVNTFAVKMISSTMGFKGYLKKHKMILSLNSKVCPSFSPMEMCIETHCCFFHIERRHGNRHTLDKVTSVATSWEINITCMYKDTDMCA